MTSDFFRHRSGLWLPLSAQILEAVRIQERWQSWGVFLLLQPLLQRVIEEGQRRHVPPVAFLLRINGKAGFISFNETIRVRVRLFDGTSEEWGFRELWERYRQIRDVEPVISSHINILWVKRRVLAWDVRSFLPLVKSSRRRQAFGWLSIGPKGAQRRRRALWDRLTEDQRERVLWDVVTDDIFTEPPRKRVPLQGLITNLGHYDLDTGDVPQPFRFLRLFDQKLGQAERWATREPFEDQIPETASAVPTPSDQEDLVEHHTRLLQGRERVAVQHLLRARLLDMELKGYCSRSDLPYEATRKAARRGLARLRKSSRRRA